MHLVGGKSGGCADGVVVRALDVWELNIPASLLFIADHGEHKGHGVVGTLNTAVGERVVGTGGNLIDAEAVVEGEGKFGENWSPLSESRVTEHPQRGIYRSTTMSTVLEAVNWASVVVYMSARRLKWSVKRRM